MSEDYTLEMWAFPKADGKIDVSSVSSVASVGVHNANVDIEKLKLPVNQWSHVSVVRNAGKLRTFVNGDPYNAVVRVRSTKRGMYQTIDSNGKVLTYPTKDSLTVALTKIRILNPDIEIFDERKHDE